MIVKQYSGHKGVFQ